MKAELGKAFASLPPAHSLEESEAEKDAFEAEYKRAVKLTPGLTPALFAALWPLLREHALRRRDFQVAMHRKDAKVR